MGGVGTAPTQGFHPFTPSSRPNPPLGCYNEGRRMVRWGWRKGGGVVKRGNQLVRWAMPTRLNLLLFVLTFSLPLFTRYTIRRSRTG
jgi:hypothetical protein